MEFGLEKCGMLVMKSAKRYTRAGIELPNKEKSERSKKRKTTNTMEYWKLTPLQWR